jgi:4-deoxy-L-threo-5-hexosulose-uronate ketol-isomerase
VQGLFAADQIRLHSQTSEDRVVLVGIQPVHQTVCLADGGFVGTQSFCERRELGILNLGGKGVIAVDRESFELEPLDCLYIGRGAKKIEFKTVDAKRPAKFYGVSYPAHQNYPHKIGRHGSYQSVELGESKNANRRVLNKIIHDEGIQSCQLVMGYTEILEGSVWNTMPPHTHGRRSEVYCYFDLPENQRVFHYMGEPNNTRHLVVASDEAVVSPQWSIHSGVGTAAYKFCWAMGGDNKVFADMDMVDLRSLK